MKVPCLLMTLILFSFQNTIGQNVEVIRFSQLQEIINDGDTPVKVINFWATWCKPCIEELPYFEKVHSTYPGDDIEVVLVSLDFVEDLATKVKAFVEKKQLRSKLYLLDETDFDKIINKVDPDWSGAIPATLIVDNRSNKKSFYERQFKEGELLQIIKTLIN